MEQEDSLIVWRDGLVCEAPPCPACGSTADKTVLLDAIRGLLQGKHIPVRMVICETCRTRYWTDLDAYEYEEPIPHPWATRFYIEQGASVDGLIEPINRLTAGSVKSCLEIGCGFGFSLDAGRVLFGWRSVGVDPSPQARAGKSALDLDIKAIYADVDTDLGGPFDVVYGSEVIEHVANPHKFLQICRAHLAPGGVLVVTTPDGNSIRPDVSTATLLPILSPEQHLVLFNAESLVSVVRAAGFAFVEPLPRQNGLVLYASDQPITIDRAPMANRVPYRLYLAGVLERPGRPAELRTGMRYRLFKELVNVGLYDEAAAVFEDVIVDCRERFGLELTPENASAIAGTIKTGYEAPFCLPGLFFFRGMLALNSSAAPGDAAPWFDAAAAAAEAFRIVYRGVGIDDGETGEIDKNAAGLALVALCHGDPSAAVSRLRAAPDTDPRVIDTVALRLLDLGHIDEANQAAALSPDTGLQALAAGIGHFMADRFSEAHAALAEAAKTDAYAARARGLDILALASFDPDAAIRLARASGAAKGALNGLFTRLVDLGHMEQALTLESDVEDEEDWQVLAHRGMVAMLHTKDTEFASELFARAFVNAPGKASETDRWQLKYYQLLARIMKGDAVGGKRVAQEILAAGSQVPGDVGAMVETLMTEHPAVRPKAA